MFDKSFGEKATSSVAKTDLISVDMLPEDSVAKAQADKAFKDDAAGDAKKVAANQRMTYAIELHQANLRLTSNSVVPLRIYVQRDADGKMTKEAQKLVKDMIEALAGKKPDYAKMTDHETGIASADYARKGTLVRDALEMAAYRDLHGCDWRMFNVETNTLLFPPKMMYPHDAKPAGRLLYSAIVDERMMPPNLVACDGASFQYEALIAPNKYKTTTKQATFAHVLSCMKPRKAKEESGREPQGNAGNDPTAKRECNPMKPSDLVRDSQAEVLMSALHTLLCGKDAGTRKLTLDSYTPSFWKHAMDIMMLIDGSRLAPDFGKITTGRTIPKNVAEYFTTKAA